MWDNTCEKEKLYRIKTFSVDQESYECFVKTPLNEFIALYTQI